MKFLREIARSKKTAQALSYIVVSVGTAALVLLVPAVRYTPLLEPTIRDVDAGEFYTKYQADPDKFLFLDVRGSDAYKRLHASGSKLQPLHTLYTERLSLPRNTDKTIVLICSGGVASGVGYSYLEHYGFRNIVRIEGGIEAWQEKGLPIEGSDVLR